MNLCVSDSPAVHVVVGPLGRGLVELGGGAVGGRRGLDEARDSLLEGVGGELGLDFLIAGEGLPVWDDGVVCETCSDDVSWRLMGKGRGEEMDASGRGATGALVEEGLRGDGVRLGELGLGQRGAGGWAGVGEDADRGVDLPCEAG